MNLITTEELDATLEEYDAKLPKIDGIKSILWKTTNQCQVLLNESAAITKPVKITGAAKRFTPNGLFYLEYLSFNGTSPRLANSLTVIVKPVDAPIFTLKLKSNKDTTFSFGFVRKFCEWFEIYSTVSSPKPLLTKINVYGTDSVQLTNFANDIEFIIHSRDNFESIKEELKKEITDSTTKHIALTEQNTELNRTVTTYHLELNRLEKLLENSQTQLQEESSKLIQLKLEANHAEERLTSASNNITQLQETSDELNKNISVLNSELKKLTSDKNLISDEYGPYVKEGSSQAKVYSALMTIPLAAIFFSIYQLYAGASKLLATENQSAIEILAAFILRIPFAAIFGVAIYYSWKIASAMIQRVFKIHSDRLTLAKLLVVARETVHSSAKNLSITDHEKFQEQTSLKIEVLKSHMARDLNEGFSYKPVPNQKQTVKEASAEASPEAVNDELVPQDLRSPA